MAEPYTTLPPTDLPLSSGAVIESGGHSYTVGDKFTHGKDAKESKYSVFIMAPNGTFGVSE